MVHKIIKVIAIGVFGIVFILIFWYGYIALWIERMEPRSIAPVQTQFIDIEGETIAYSEIDNRAPQTIIFVGGLSAWNGTWERVIQSANAQTKGFNYVAIDLPPFGFSIPDVSKGYMRDVQAERIKSFIEKRGFTKVILVGHSYGAGPVVEYALHNIDTVEKLILIDAVLNIDESKEQNIPLIFKSDIFRTGLISILVHNDSFALSRLRSFVYKTDHINQELLDVYTQYLNTEGASVRLSKWVLDYMRDPLVYQSTNSENYSTIPFPVRLIWGDKDTLTPISGTDIVLENVPDIKLYTLVNVGHIPMIEDYVQFDTIFQKALME